MPPARAAFLLSHLAFCFYFVDFYTVFLIIIQAAHYGTAWFAIIKMFNGVALHLCNAPKRQQTAS